MDENIFQEKEDYEKYWAGICILDHLLQFKMDL